MKLFAILFFLVFHTAAVAREPLVFLVNGTDTYVSVEVAEGEPELEIPPGVCDLVAIRQLRWLRFGQEARRYNLGAIRALASRSATPLALQAGPGARLYLLPPSSTSPATSFPPQPKGFPVRPTKDKDKDKDFNLPRL